MKNVKKTHKAVVSALTSIAAISMLAVPVFATTNTYAEAGAKWILDGLFWVVLVFGVAYGGMSLIKGNVTRGIITIALAALVCFLCTDAGITAIQSLGTALKNVFGL